MVCYVSLTEYKNFFLDVFLFEAISTTKTFWSCELCQVSGTSRVLGKGLT